MHSPQLKYPIGRTTPTHTWIVLQRNHHRRGEAEDKACCNTAEEQKNVLFHLVFLFLAISGRPLATRKEWCHIGHDKAQGVQDRPSDDDALEPCPGFIHCSA